MRRVYTIQENGQVTLPVEWLRKYGLKKGDVVSFEETSEGKLVVVPRTVLVTDALDQIGEALKERGISLEELLERGRAIRGQLLKERYGLDVPSDE
jgi:AbrB family looped-hinge helix DNA binding protein